MAPARCKREYLVQIAAFQAYYLRHGKALEQGPQEGGALKLGG